MTSGWAAAADTDATSASTETNRLRGIRWGTGDSLNEDSTVTRRRKEAVK